MVSSSVSSVSPDRRNVPEDKSGESSPRKAAAFEYPSSAASIEATVADFSGPPVVSAGAGAPGAPVLKSLFLSFRYRA